jgi:hypothetical protein
MPVEAALLTHCISEETADMSKSDGQHQGRLWPLPARQADCLIRLKEQHSYGNDPRIVAINLLGKIHNEHRHVLLLRCSHN